MVAVKRGKKKVFTQLVSPKQRLFMRATLATRGSGVHKRRYYPITSYCGGRGSGKTTIGARAVARHAKADEPWLCLGPSSPMIVQGAFPVFVNECKALGILIDQVGGADRRVIFRTRDGGKATLFFKSGFNPETVRGGSYAGLWNDESSFTPQLAFQNAVLSLRWKMKSGPIFLTFTPRGRFHWTFDQHYKEIEDDNILQRYIKVSPELLTKFVDSYYVRHQRIALIRSASTDSPFLDPRFVQEAKRTMTAALYRQEIGGNFEDVAGLMFSRHDFVQISELELPDFSEMRLVRYFDKADNEGGGSQNASVLMGMHHMTGKIYILDVWFEHCTAGERNKKMHQLMDRDALRYGPGYVENYIEREGGSAGKEINRLLINQFAGHSVFEDIVSGQQYRVVFGEQIPGKAKINRALPFAAQVENHNVHYVKSIPRIGKALDQICAFPEAQLADVVDAASGCIVKLTMTTPPEGMIAARAEYTEPETKLMQAMQRFYANAKPLTGR